MTGYRTGGSVNALHLIWFMFYRNIAIDFAIYCQGRNLEDTKQGRISLTCLKIPTRDIGLTG